MTVGPRADAIEQKITFLARIRNRIQLSGPQPAGVPTLLSQLIVIAEAPEVSACVRALVVFL
jgi:hypothetical protein